MTGVYMAAVVISFLSLLAFIVISDKKVLFYNASFFIFVFISNVGNLFISLSKDLSEAIVANKMTYISGCILALMLIMLVCDACKINFPKVIRLGMYGLNATVLLLSLTIGYTDWFYKDCHIEKIGNATILVKEYGPCHILFLIMMFGYMIGGLILLSYSLVKQKKLVYKNIMLMLFIYLLAVICYTVGRRIFPGLDLVCLSYCVDDLILLYITYDTCIYNLDEALLTSVEKQDSQGYLLFDKKYNFLGCNNVAYSLIADLEGQKLDKRLAVAGSEVLTSIDQCVMNYSGIDEKSYVAYDGKDIEIYVQYLYKAGKMRGYIVRIADDTKQQEYIRKLDLVATSKSNFLSNVSHEIRTPINSILGMNEMILRECTEKQIKEYASIIATSGQTLLQLINDVLDMTKIESGKSEVIPSEYDIADVIGDLEKMIRPLIKKENLSFVIETGDNIPKTLYGDAIRIKQMITNILTNAVKYTDEGTVTFSISGKRKGDIFTFKFAVKDTGRGIKEEDIPKLFNAFERVDQRKNSGILGTGLGLAITQKFATMMGGDIDVQSEYGVGTTFIITIPQKIIDYEVIGDFKAESGRRASDVYQESFHAPDAKVLVVDDVDINLMVVELLLKEIGMQIKCCSGGRECIEAVKNEHFDVILLDHMMPDIDGIETLNIIRNEHLADDTPIIALTANTEADAEKSYLEYGFDGYLPKPVYPEGLEKMIYDMLPKSKVQ